jgi:hypothetical protein
MDSGKIRCYHGTVHLVIITHGQSSGDGDPVIKTSKGWVPFYEQSFARHTISENDNPRASAQN